MKTLLLVLALSAFANAENLEIQSAKQKKISIATVMYPSGSINMYLSLEHMLRGEEALKVCPNGVARVSKINISVEADFEVNEDRSQAQTYPKVKKTAIVTCR
jgi:hypothetical protein